jgi:hypothetical protein
MGVKVVKKRTKPPLSSARRLVIQMVTGKKFDKNTLKKSRAPFELFGS